MNIKNSNYSIPYVLYECHKFSVNHVKCMTSGHRLQKEKKHFNLNGCFQDSKIDSCPVPTYGILIKTQLLQLTFVSKTLDDFLLNHYLTKY